MSTNYYLRFKHKEEDKKNVKELVDSERYEDALQLLDNMCAGLHYDVCSKEFVGTVLHIGKRSSGWTFLWETNWFFDDKGQVHKLYELNKESLKAYIDQEDADLYDEYGEKQDKEEFWKMALEWGQPDGWDYEKYCEHEKSKTHETPWSAYVRQDMIDFWKKYGIDTDSYGQEFYSDGLRFSTGEFR